MTGSAREALIAEAIGEMATLLDRIEAAKPAIDAARDARVQASANLAGQVADAENRITAIADSATVQAIRQIARRSEELARSAAEAETEAMRAAARDLFRTELGPTLQRFAQTVNRGGSPNQPRFGAWWSHALTAIAAAGGTLAAVTFLWWR